MGPEAPRTDQHDEYRLRFEMQEKIAEVDDALETLPAAPDKQMLRHVLSAASSIIHPGDEKKPWAHRARLLRPELEGALRELRRLEDEEL